MISHLISQLVRLSVASKISQPFRSQHVLPYDQKWIAASEARRKAFGSGQGAYQEICLPFETVQV
jgi:hypothetical protein